MTRGWGSKSVDRTGEVIRDILRSGEEFYGQQLWRLVKERTKRHPSYNSFNANYLHKMRKLGLIERTHLVAPPIPGFRQRQLWRMVPGTETLDSLWNDPQGQYRQQFGKKVK